jgi:hypothetical protein
MDCLHLLFTRHHEDRAVRGALVGLLLRVLQEPDSLSCHRVQIFQRPSFSAFVSKCSALLWQCLNDSIVIKDSAVVIAIGMTEMLDNVSLNVRPSSIGVIVRVLQHVCSEGAFGVALALHRSAKIACRADLWSLVAEAQVPDVALLLELAREEQKSFQQQWPLILALCKVDLWFSVLLVRI